MADVDNGTDDDRWDLVADSYGLLPATARMAGALADLVDIAAGDSVIDLGTGTGFALLPAAASSRTGRMVGLDRSMAMLKNLGRRATQAVPPAKPVLVRADAAHVPVPDECFDVALAASLWQFLGYSPDALVEWRRILRPGGRLGLTVPAPGSRASISSELMAKYFDKLSSSAQERILGQGSRPPIPDLVEATTQAGFTNATVITRSFNDTLDSGEDWWAIQWTHGVRFFLEGLDPTSLEQLKADSLERLEHNDAGQIVLTTNTIYCIAHR